MGEKKAFALRINQEILKELEAWAADEFRSTNGQIEFLLHEALQARKKKLRKNNTDKHDEHKKAEDVACIPLPKKHKPIYFF